MLHDVKGQHRAEARRSLRRERREEVALDGLEPALPAHRHHPGAAVDAARRDPVVAQQRQRLATAAAEVERRSPRGLEIGQVAGDALADLLLGAAIPPLELEVGVLLTSPPQARGRPVVLIDPGGLSHDVDGTVSRHSVPLEVNGGPREIGLFERAATWQR